MVACLNRDTGTCVADSDGDVGIFLTTTDCDTALFGELVRIVEQLFKDGHECLTVRMDVERIRNLAFYLDLYFIRHIQFHSCCRLSAKRIATEGRRFANQIVLTR